MFKENVMEDKKSRIKKFIVENFLFGNDNGLKDDTSFLDEGIIDSTGVLELIGFIEETFSVQVEDDELVPENLDSIDRLCKFIEIKEQDVA